jgi:hypothetical protein
MCDRGVRVCQSGPTPTRLPTTLGGTQALPRLEAHKLSQLPHSIRLAQPQATRYGAYTLLDTEPTPYSLRCALA